MHYKWRMGVVELRVKLPLRPTRSLSRLMQHTIIDQRAMRAMTVRAVLKKQFAEELDIIVFPGWTLVGWSLPQWVSELAGPRVIAMEMLLPQTRKLRESAKGSGDDCDLPWKTFMNIARIRRGRVIRPPCFPVELDLILNPAHTPSRLEAMRKKRRFLSRGRVLVSTSNTHSRWQLRSKEQVLYRSAGHVGAECFHDGRRLRPLEKVPVDTATVAIFEIAASHRQRS